VGSKNTEGQGDRRVLRVTDGPLVGSKTHHVGCNLNILGLQTDPLWGRRWTLLTAVVGPSLVTDGPLVGSKTMNRSRHRHGGLVTDGPLVGSKSSRQSRGCSEDLVTDGPLVGSKTMIRPPVRAPHARYRRTPCGVEERTIGHRESTPCRVADGPLVGSKNTHPCLQTVVYNGYRRTPCGVEEMRYSR